LVEHKDSNQEKNNKYYDKMWKENVKENFNQLKINKNGEIVRDLTEKKGKDNLKTRF
jgi:hypothetical protein